MHRVSLARVRTLFLMTLMMVLVFGAAFDAQQCACQLFGGAACGGTGRNNSGNLNACTGQGGIVGCISSPGGSGNPPVSYVPTEPAGGAAIAGFSAGSWFGTYPPPGYQSQALPNALYKYGILDASNGPASTITLCGGSSTFSPQFSGGAQSLVANPPTSLEAFWFLTSTAYARDICKVSVTPDAWGKQQADWFILALIALPQTEKQAVIMTAADIEIIAGDISEWTSASYADNQTVISSFFAELENGFSTCGCNSGTTAIYTGPSVWWQIIGPYNDTASQPWLGTPWLWMSSYGPSQTTLNGQEDLFTGSPGGYYLWSWQYTNAGCDPTKNACNGSTTEGVCFMTYAQAQTETNNAKPPIRAFDKWTISAPDQVCQ